MGEESKHEQFQGYGLAQPVASLSADSVSNKDAIRAPFDRREDRPWEELDANGQQSKPCPMINDSKVDPIHAEFKVEAEIADRAGLRMWSCLDCSQCLHT